MKTNTLLNISDYLKKKNVKRFSLFFIIATVFLIFSKLSNDYKQTIKLKINLINLQKEIIIKDDSLDIVDAYVEGKGFSFLPFLFNNTKTINVDVNTDITSKPSYYTFDVQEHKFFIENQLGTSYKILSLKPDTLGFRYSEKASKLVPLNLNSSINFALGYDVKNDFKLSVDSVKIIGSELELEKLSSLSTENLVLNEVKNDINETIDINISAYRNIEIFPKSVNVKAEIKRFTEGTIEIPITIQNKPNDLKLNYFPKSVTLSYYVDLDNYDHISSLDFSIICDYSELKVGQTYFVPKIKKEPEFVKRSSIKQKRIDFIKL